MFVGFAGASVCVVDMIDVRVEVDGVKLHGVDLANALELKLVQPRSIEFYTKDGASGASIHCLVVFFVALPPGVGDSGVDTHSLSMRTMHWGWEAGGGIAIAGDLKAEEREAVLCELC